MMPVANIWPKNRPQGQFPVSTVPAVSLTIDSPSEVAAVHPGVLGAGEDTVATEATAG